MLFPTPSLSHLSKSDLQRIYEPAEDTFIFLDALEADAHLLRADKPRLVVEIGAFVAAILGKDEAAYLCTDINPHAVQCTSKTGQANQVSLEPVLTSLLSALLSRVQGRGKRQRQQEIGKDIKEEEIRGAPGLVDLLLFNPPYVPTTEEEEIQAQRDASLSGSWAGGSLGVRLLHTLIEGSGGTDPAGDGDDDHDADRPSGGIESILSPNGHFYCVAIRQNDPQDILQRLRARSLHAEIVLDRKAGREHLFVIRGSKRVRA